MKHNWKRMSSGKYIDFENLTTDDIKIEDINTALNYIYRFTGHWKDQPPMTVAQHTYLCMLIAKELFPGDKEVQLAVLLHDWPETYYGDMSTPIKRLLTKRTKQLLSNIDDLVIEKFWVSDKPYEIFEDEVKLCDYSSLDIERRNMWKSTLGKDKWPPVENGLIDPHIKKDLWDHVIQHKPFVDLKQEYERLVNGTS